MATPDQNQRLCAEIARALWFVPEVTALTQLVLEGSWTPVDWVRAVTDHLPLSYTEEIVDDALVHIAMNRLAARWILAMEDLGRPLTERQQLDLLECALTDVGDHFCAEVESEVIGIGQALSLWTRDPDGARRRLEHHLPRISGDPRILLATLTDAPCRDLCLFRFESVNLSGSASDVQSQIEHFRALGMNESSSYSLVDRLDELAVHARGLQNDELALGGSRLGWVSLGRLADQLVAALVDDE